MKCNGHTMQQYQALQKKKMASRNTSMQSGMKQKKDRVNTKPTMTIVHKKRRSTKRD